MSNNSNGWETYSKLVLQQLETLSGGIEALRNELQMVQTQLTELKAKEDRVQDLKAWKEKMDDVASPPQLRETIQEVESLKIFKTKAVTMFMVIQGIMGLAMAWGLEIF
jgi:TolA-binding protein